MDRRKHSIRTKVTLVTLVVVLVSAMLIGAVSIVAIKREGDSDTSRQMNLICDDGSKAIDEFLNGVEHSVNMIARYAAEDLNSKALVKGGVSGATGWGDFERGKFASEADQDALEGYMAGHIDRVGIVFRSVANHTPGVMSYYYRINPEITTDAVGFFYSKITEGTFKRIPLTDISAYDPEDDAHVGWYYNTLRAGAAIWLPPYTNENLNEKLISYISPIYKAGAFIGVIGMDIAYDTLVSRVEKIHLFDTGYAYLAKEDGEIVYHPIIDIEELGEAFDSDNTPTATYLKRIKSTGESTIPYTYRGEKKEMAFTTLANGLRLIVVAPDREINAGWHRLVNYIILLGIAILAVTAIIMTVTMQHITQPLARLTEASRQMIAGNYDVDLNYSHSDEVGTLTEAF